MQTTDYPDLPSKIDTIRADTLTFLTTYLRFPPKRPMRISEFYTSGSEMQAEIHIKFLQESSRRDGVIALFPCAFTLLSVKSGLDLDLPSGFDYRVLEARSAQGLRGRKGRTGSCAGFADRKCAAD